MRIYVGIDALEPPDGGSAVTIGTFDGVHVGHRMLMEKAKDHAVDRGARSTVVTWDRHPAVTLRPDKAPPVLASSERKVELIEESGIDILTVLPFDHAFSQWSPERFVEEVLVKGLNAKYVVVGHDWRFGRKQSGDVELLTRLGSGLGFEVEGVGLEEVDGQPVSSTRIREAIGRGDMDTARLLLARPFDLEGSVLRGDRRGTQLGFPTANLELPAEMVHPPRGVYAGRARVGELWYAAAIDVGVNPQFGGEPDRTPMKIEAFLLDFAGDVYDQNLRVEFHKRLRDELTFPSVDDLLAQMADDVAATRILNLE